MCVIVFACDLASLLYQRPYALSARDQVFHQCWKTTQTFSPADAAQIISLHIQIGFTEGDQKFLRVNQYLHLNGWHTYKNRIS